jgi:hypothetical protein
MYGDPYIVIIMIWNMGNHKAIMKTFDEGLNIAIIMVW